MLFYHCWYTLFIVDVHFVFEVIYLFISVIPFYDDVVMMIPLIVMIVTCYWLYYWRYLQFYSITLFLLIYYYSVDDIVDFGDILFPILFDLVFIFFDIPFVIDWYYDIVMPCDSNLLMTHSDCCWWCYYDPGYSAIYYYLLLFGITFVFAIYIVRLLY